VVYYTNQPPVSEKKNNIYIKRPGKLSIKRVRNLIQLRVSNELTQSDIHAYVPDQKYIDIFCGEITLYRALRQAFPNVHLQVRFHNFFSVLTCRNTFFRYKLPFITKLNFFLLTRLEREILSDRNVTPIFITKEEFNFFRVIHPAKQAYCWSVVKANYTQSTSELTAIKPIIVWFGGVSMHKSYSLRYFINHIFPQLKKPIPELSFHMFGKGTENLSDEAMHIHGHGFYEGTELPYGKEALYINPDLLGGGVKLKIGDLLEAGVPFISTPFGVEGYTIHSQANIIIAEIDSWRECILHYFRSQ
jgi:hypothetical protein